MDRKDNHIETTIIITSDKESEKLIISDKPNIGIQKTSIRFVRFDSLILLTVTAVILLYLAIFIIVPILQLIYAYNFNNSIICNVRFTNGTLRQFVNDDTNIGEFKASDFVIIDGICELIFQTLLVTLHVHIIKYKTKLIIFLITILLIINSIRYFSFEIIFVNYLTDLWNTCSHNYLAFTNIQHIMNVSELEDVLIARVMIGVLNFIIQGALSLYYGIIILKNFI